MYMYVRTNTATPITSQHISSSAGAGKAALVVAALLVTATIVGRALVHVYRKINNKR